MQPKLLRVLEEREFERIGGTKVIQPDFRLIAATNQKLENMMSEGRFRKDLFYRLNVIALHIPPLRERREDIIPLARHLVKQIATEASLTDINIGARARQTLANYDWPGNVRELSNTMERVLSSLVGNTINLFDLPFYLHGGGQRSTSVNNPAPLRDVLAMAEAEAIRRTLSETNNTKALAAKRLGIHRTLLYKKMKKHGIALDAKLGN